MHLLGQTTRNKVVVTHNEIVNYMHLKTAKIIKSPNILVTLMKKNLTVNIVPEINFIAMIFEIMLSLSISNSQINIYFLKFENRCIISNHFCCNCTTMYISKFLTVCFLCKII